MLTNNQIKQFSSLKLKKFRQKYNQFIVEGNKLVEEALNSEFQIEHVIATNNWLNNSDIEIPTTNLIETDFTNIKKISSLSTPQEVVAIVKIPEQTTVNVKVTEKLILALDNISDPGNLGTIIRLCDWFGIDNIICSIDTVDVYNPKTAQSTMGSIFRVNVNYVKLESFLKPHFEEKKTNIYGAFLEGENIYKTDLQKNGILVLGSESHGISPKIANYIKKKLTIPHFNNSRTESLNVAISSAIFCSEFMRR